MKCVVCGRGGLLLTDVCKDKVRNRTRELSWNDSFECFEIDLCIVRLVAGSMSCAVQALHVVLV